MKLSEILFGNIVCGTTRIWNASKTYQGTVIEKVKLPNYKEWDLDGEWVTVKWDAPPKTEHTIHGPIHSGGESSGPLYDFDKCEVVGDNFL